MSVDFQNSYFPQKTLNSLWDYPSILTNIHINNFSGPTFSSKHGGRNVRMSNRMELLELSTSCTRRDFLKYNLICFVLFGKDFAEI